MNTDNILSVLDNYTFETVDDIALKLAEDFRRRRIEKNLTREEVAQLADVALSNLVRFEQKGLISLKNLIALAMALGYTSEIKNLFATPKYATMEELTQIRKNANKKKVYKKQ
jgi:transcriptional regulator with XRE-family HTH domain